MMVKQKITFKYGKLSSITEFDSEGRKIHYKHVYLDSNYEEWYEYNSEGKETYFHNTRGFKMWSEYDSNGNLIHSKDTEHNEKWYKYDSEGRVIYHKNSLGYKAWFKYDKQGRLAYKKDSFGTADKYIYYNDKE